MILTVDSTVVTIDVGVKCPTAIDMVMDGMSMGLNTESSEGS